MVEKALMLGRRHRVPVLVVLVLLGLVAGWFVTRGSASARVGVVPEPTVVTIPEGFPDRDTIVPNLVGRSQPEVGELLRVNGLIPEEFGFFDDPVSFQAPGAGETVRTGTVIVVMYGTGVEILDAARARAAGLGYESSNSTDDPYQPRSPLDDETAAAPDGYDPTDPTGRGPFTPEEEAENKELFPPQSVAPSPLVEGGSFILSWAPRFSPDEVDGLSLRVVTVDGAVLVTAPPVLSCQTVRYRFDTPQPPGSLVIIEAVVAGEALERYEARAFTTVDGLRLYLEAVARPNDHPEIPTRPLPLPRFGPDVRPAAPEMC